MHTNIDTYARSRKRARIHTHAHIYIETQASTHTYGLTAIHIPTQYMQSAKALKSIYSCTYKHANKHIETPQFV